RPRWVARPPPVLTTAMTNGSSGRGAAETVCPDQVPLNGIWSPPEAGPAAAMTARVATARRNANGRMVRLLSSGNGRRNLLTPPAPEADPTDGGREGQGERR